MGKLTIDVQAVTPDGKDTVIQLARPDLLDMSEINKRQEEWQKIVDTLKKGTTPPGLFEDINDFLVHFAPALCVTHSIGIIDGGEIPEADFYIVTSKEAKLPPELLLKRLPSSVLMAMFTGIMESTADVGAEVGEGATKSAEFRGPTVRGRGGSSGKAKRPPAK